MTGGPSFPFLDGLQPPAWLVREVQRRVVLFVNHVLMQEGEAQTRLARQAGRVLLAQWRQFELRLVATPAGLLDLDDGTQSPDLTITLAEASPFGLAQAALRGEKPPVHIAGDVQFAAEVNWLVDNVRWDLEEDLSRVIGDVPAHALADAGRAIVGTLREFVARRPAADTDAGA
jgi:ubiquinone biosynthesis protein UbiJ